MPNSIFVSNSPSATLSEHMFFMATIRTDMSAHIFNYTQNRNFNLLKHFYRFSCIQKRNILWRSHNHSARNRHLLCQCQLYVASTRWQVNNKIIEITPLGLLQHLVQHLSHHWPTPDHRCVFFDQKSNRHCLKLVASHRVKTFLTFNFRSSTYPEHSRLTGPVDICVQYTNFPALCR